MIDKLSAYGILLVFMSLLFIHIEKHISDFLKKERPNSAQQKALSSYKSAKLYLTFKSVIVSVIIFCIWYITLPDTVEIIKNSELNFWDFDELKTTYVIVSYCLFGMFGVIGYRLYLLIKK